MQLGRSDASYGELVERLKPGWDDTVLITVSDHQQEQITHPESVNLRGACDQRGWDAKERLLDAQQRPEILNGHVGRQLGSLRAY